MTTTIQSLATEYVDSLQFERLSDNSRKTYVYALRAIIDEIGDVPVGDVKRSTALKLQQRFRRTPAKANVVVSVLSVLMAHAVDMELRENNPVKQITSMNIGEWSAWPDHAIEAFRLASSGMARRTFFLCLYTGQRIGDVIRMRWSDIKAGGTVITVRQQKTGTDVIIPLHIDLINEMNRWAAVTDHILYRVRKSGTLGPYSHSVIYEEVMQQADDLGLCGLTIHGLRKNASKMMAEAGCTDREIMAITGHTTTAMVSHYTREVEKALLARKAIDKLEQHSQGVA